MDIFEKMAEIGQKAFNRRKLEHGEWLASHRKIVESAPSEVVSLFGNLSVDVYNSEGKKASWGIELTVADHLFWRDEFDKGARFVDRPADVTKQMVHHLAKSIEKSTDLEPEERKALLKTLD